MGTLKLTTMSARKQLEKEIREAVVFLREKNSTVPSETIQFMLDASMEKMSEIKEDPVMAIHKKIDMTMVILETNTAYSLNRYTNKAWREIAEFLYNQSEKTTLQGVVEVLNSKHMRWCADGRQFHDRKANFIDFMMYYNENRNDVIKDFMDWC